MRSSTSLFSTKEHLIIVGFVVAILLNAVVIWRADQTTRTLNAENAASNAAYLHGAPALPFTYDEVAGQGDIYPGSFQEPWPNYDTWACGKFAHAEPLVCGISGQYTSPTFRCDIPFTRPCPFEPNYVPRTMSLVPFRHPYDWGERPGPEL